MLFLHIAPLSKKIPFHDLEENVKYEGTQTHIREMETKTKWMCLLIYCGCLITVHLVWSNIHFGLIAASPRQVVTGPE